MSFTILALGDSVMWGQGLLEKDKFHTQVKNEVANIAKTNVTLCVYAHSGAKIAHQSEDATSAGLWGEIPMPYPSIHAQLDKAKGELKPADVRLVLVDGGINDVDVMEIVSPNPVPWIDKAAQIRERTRQLIEKPMANLLIEILDAFPNTFVVVPGYYQIVAEWSNADMAADILAPLTLTVSILAFKTMVLHSEAFHQASTGALQGAVATANARHGEKRVFYAHPNLSAVHALGTVTSYLWSGEDDPLYNGRKAWLQINGRGFDPTTERASMGHPNVQGARMYTAAIMQQVRAFANKLAPHYQPSECDQIRERIAKLRIMIQVLNETKASLNPRNPADRREIAAINAEIKPLQQEITKLQQQAQALGCPPI
jgi:lysophospholipase L1-like esterase